MDEGQDQPVWSGAWLQSMVWAGHWGGGRAWSPGERVVSCHV